MAKALLGKIYYTFEKNYDEACALFAKTLSQNDDPDACGIAQAHLGDMYFLGDGVECDYETARTYYVAALQHKAQKKNRLGSLCRLGDISFYGLVGEPDYQQAGRNYEELAQKNRSGFLARAKTNLAQLKYLGLYGERDYKTACQLLEEAQKDASDRSRSYAQALWKEVVSARSIMDSTERDKHFYEAVSNQDFDLFAQTRAQSQLGLLYYNEKNYARALPYFLALENKTVNPYARMLAYAHLGECYYQGHGVEKDLGKARGYFEKVAAQKLNLSLQAQAHRRLGEIYADLKKEASSD